MRDFRFGRRYDPNELNYFAEKNIEKLVTDCENKITFDIMAAAGEIIGAGESLKAVLGPLSLRKNHLCKAPLRGALRCGNGSKARFPR